MLKNSEHTEIRESKEKIVKLGRIEKHLLKLEWESEWELSLKDLSSKDDGVREKNPSIVLHLQKKT